MTKKTIGVVLAGGQGSRLKGLTSHRAKPAVPFAGKYRIIDFVLGNFFNSGIKRLLVLTQYVPHSLGSHIQTHWAPLMGWNEYINVLPPKLKSATDNLYQGTADAVYQNWEPIVTSKAKRVAIFGGDHIYKMDLSQMGTAHRKNNADFTICCEIVPVDLARGNLGVLEVDESHRVIGFEEKPMEPKEIPGRPGYVFASMGNYLANTSFLGPILETDADDPSSEHDFGKDIIPKIISTSSVYAYPLSENEIEGEVGHYWRDVGTLPAYLEASMNLCEHLPELNLYNEEWQIPTYPDNLPAAKFVGKNDGTGFTRFSMISGGCVIDDAQILWSILGRSNRIGEHSVIEGSVLFDQVTLGRNVHLRNVICDKEVSIPDNMRIGYDRGDDTYFGLHTENFGDGWLTVIPKRHQFA